MENQAKSPRKFKVGDIVKSSRGIGIVGWTKNECMSIKEEDGLLGLDLQTGSRGFLSPVKDEDCEKSSLKEIISYYESKTKEANTKTQEYANRLRNYEAIQKENRLLKELLVRYFCEEER